MTKIRFRPARINNDQSLFDWSERQYRDGASYAVRRLSGRYGLLPATAATLADAFGIGGGQ